MSEYYGMPSTSSEDFLAHYGVKGMKWGVRRALSKSGASRSKALARQYKRASRKLRKLNYYANTKEQEKLAKNMNKIAKVGLGVGIAGMSVSGAARIGNNILHKKFLDAHNNFYYPGFDRDVIKSANLFYSGDREGYDAYKRKRWQQAKDYEDAANNLGKYSKIRDVASTIGRTSLGISAGAKIMAANAKWRTTPKGHAKRVAKRNEWRNHMLDTFKDTKYANLPNPFKQKKYKF